jgi:adenine-specific DNA-methyltransferase
MCNERQRMENDTNLEKLKILLRELFQFDRADLDFGIYRIMNHKREVLETFISEDLPAKVSKELEKGALADQGRAADELAEIAAQIRSTLQKDAIDAEGNLAEAFKETEIGRKYLKLRSETAGGRGLEALEASVYNHLVTFFSRYYQDGDFISKRRYSKRQKYAIPYNGEEVYLYWANHDQYYVKTGEYFADYSYKDTHGTAVHFKLTAADVEQDNVKGDKRFFLARPKETGWDASSRQVTIPFEYRPLTKQEQIRYGTQNQQEALIAEAVAQVPGQLKGPKAALAALTAGRQKSSGGEPVSYLEHHLRQYTRRNTSDFFIHKDLKGFLSRELDVYLKNEVLNLDEMETAGEDVADGWFQMMCVIKAIGVRIIEFLAQIENFQKMLWEKRKFVTETQYCFTVGNIPEEFHKEIVTCDAQWEEWRDLYHIDEEEPGLYKASKTKEKKRSAFIQSHPTLVVDTKHFGDEYVDRLIGSLDDLDEVTDGLLVNSENLQALNLLERRYADSVKCIYIDPPYNTGNDGFVYKDSYQHSSWLAMMVERLEASRGVLSSQGVFFASIDDNEYWRLWPAASAAFGEDNYLGSLVWKRRSSSAMAGHPLSLDHEYLLVYGKNAAATELTGLVRRIEDYPFEDQRGRYVSTDLSVGMTREQRPGQFYPITNPRSDVTYQANPQRVWRFFPETMAKVIEDDLVIWPDEVDGKLTRPRYKTYFDPDVLKPKPLSSWVDTNSTNDREIEEEEAEYDAAILKCGMNQEGGRVYGGLFGYKSTTYPKPVSLVRSLLRASLQEGELVADFFAGTGTTAHAAISLGREDGRRRRFLLVEMAEEFAHSLVPLVSKVTYCPDWRDGKPVPKGKLNGVECLPRIVRRHRLESYEDSLNNIEFASPEGQGKLEFDDYLLKYMLEWETQKSDTLLNVAKMHKPFSYTLKVSQDGETQEKAVDLPETYNYLLGLHVKTRRVVFDKKRRYLVYRGAVDNRRVAVIWRETEDWSKEDLERDRQFVAEEALTAGADEVYVNGDSFIPGARALEPVFKAKMFAEVQI